ncbi:hypothetical protein DITRI_Ditri02bG0182800 [Diplodiscus trichospermus]
METPSPLPFHVDLCVILSESRRIIKAHSCHFLALSILFLLPVSFSVSVFPVIYQLVYQSSTPTIETHLGFLNTFQQQPPVFPTKVLIFTHLYNLFTLIFSIFAAGSITYSVFHGFYGRPVKLVSAIKSAFTSFFRLVATSLVSELIISGFLTILGLVLFSLIKATQLLGFQVDISSPYFISLCMVFLIIFFCILVYLQVNWAVAYVVVVVESSWGLEPLKRSKILVKGMKWVAFSMLLFYWFFGGIFGWVSSVGWDEAAGGKWKSWTFVMHIVSTSSLLMMIMLSYLAASTVFYIYSKAIHGELPGEAAQEFEREYVSLPFDDDDGKVAHVV